ncbi:MAG: hypothetical protein Q9164_001880 [Protoblastenia rupestris]
MSPIESKNTPALALSTSRAQSCAELEADNIHISTSSNLREKLPTTPLGQSGPDNGQRENPQISKPPVSLREGCGRALQDDSQAKTALTSNPNRGVSRDLGAHRSSQMNARHAAEPFRLAASSTSTTARDVRPSVAKSQRSNAQLQRGNTKPNISNSGRRVNRLWTQAASLLAPSKDQNASPVRSGPILHSVKNRAPYCSSMACWTVLGLTVSVIIGALSLRYAYNQQNLAFEQMSLAKWTARKDFLEMCRDATTLVSRMDCERLSREMLPAPPYTALDASKKVSKRTLDFTQDVVKAGLQVLQPIDESSKLRFHMIAFSLFIVLIIASITTWKRRKWHEWPRAFDDCIMRGEFSQRSKSDFNSQRPPSSLPEKAEDSTYTKTWIPATTGHLRHRGPGLHLPKGKNIWDAASFGDLDSIKAHLQYGADINTISGDRGSILTTAAAHSQTSTVMFLLSKDPNVNAQGGRPNTALNAAAWNGDESIVRMLLENGADPNIGCGLAGTAIQNAALRGHDVVVQMLLNNHADVNANPYGDNSMNALHGAISMGHESTVRLLMNRGASVDLRSRMARESLRNAIVKGWRGIVTTMLAHAAVERGVSGVYSRFLEIEEKGERAVYEFLKKEMELLEAFRRDGLEG